MQDVTDLAFMRTLARLGSLPDMFVTPYFRSTRTGCILTEANLRCIEENGSGIPVIAQLAGSDVGALARDAEYFLQRPVAGINLNAGCPSPLVNRHGAGAGLLRDLPSFGAVLRELRRVTPAGQLSVKCRLGWEDAAEFPSILGLLSEAGPDMVMVHARTRKELYGGAPHEEAARAAARSLRCPVLGNGNIVSLSQAEHWLSGVTPDGIMIGRGAVRNPYLFRMLKGGDAPTREEMRLYYQILAEETGGMFRTCRTTEGHCNRMKKYLAFCYADFGAETEYALRRCTDMRQMLKLLGNPWQRRS